MAYTKKSTKPVKDVEEVIEEEKIVEKTTEVKVKDTITEKKFEPEDLIPCRSMVSGALYIEGSRSKLLYSWADYNDVQEVEYRDLVYMARTHNDKNIYEPRIIVEDDDFVAQNKTLSDFYESMYSTVDLREIIDLPANQMIKAIDKLPVGAKNALKGIASTLIDSGYLDSVSKIRVLDEAFGTNMLLTLVEK